MKNEHLLQIRVSKSFLRGLDKWRGAQLPLRSRAQAIRIAVRDHLTQKSEYEQFFLDLIEEHEKRVPGTKAYRKALSLSERK